MSLFERINERWVGLAVLIIIVAGAGVLLGGLEPHPLLTIAIKQGVEGVALKKVAERYSECKKIPTKVIEFPYEELYRKELAQLDKRAAEDDARFDVIMVDDPWFTAFMEHPKDSTPRLKELALKKKEWKDLDLEDFAEHCRRVCQSPYCTDDQRSCDNSYYALPFVGNSQLFCYQKTDFPKCDLVPKTWPHVLDASSQIKQDTKRKGYVARVGPDNSIVTDFMAMLWAYDPDSFPPTSSSGVKAFQSVERATEACRFLTQLVPKESIGSACNDDLDLAASLMKRRASMGIVWSAWAMMLKNLEYSNHTNELCFADVPGGPPELGTWLLAIPFNSHQPDLAEDFIRFATSKDQITLAATEGNPPPRKSVLNLLNLNVTEAQQQILEKYRELFSVQLRSLERARPRPRTPHWKEIEGLLGKELANLIAGEIQPEEAVCKVNERISHLLAPPEASKESHQ